jgi:oxygen-independent coproporphyrinogen-3 oxidase
MNTTRDTLNKLIEDGAIPPFVYCYPTRSAYVEYGNLSIPWTIPQIWEEDLNHSPSSDLNLYIHVPFCRYKCGFCNLYTIISTDQSEYDAYTDALCKQLEESRGIIERRNLRTIYIGGGTPSLLSRSNFASIFNKITDIYPNWRSITDEVCLEATPDSIADSEEPNIVKYLVDLGVTRINMGVQSLRKIELKAAGRLKANEDVIRKAASIAKRCNLPNLSTDLIMGFEGQTDETWEQSVRELVDLDPETISTYFLTIRPDAWFSKTGRYTYHRDPHLYSRYDIARDIILAAGYVQESNVRYKRQGLGGYRQKVLQFQGVPYLGIGAGARTYTNTVDYIIGGSHKPSHQQVAEYIQAIRNHENLIKAGFEYNDDERIRKRLVLDLFNLDVRDLERYHFSDRAHNYMETIEAGIDEGVIAQVGPSRYQLTRKGFKYRDILSWLLFSDTVVERDARFYQNIHESNGLTQIKGLEDRPTISLRIPEPLAAGALAESVH